MPNHDQPTLTVSVLPEPLPADPIPLFVQMFDEAVARRVQPNPNAMTLATLDPDGTLSARIVLCKAIAPDQGHLTFYTNYTSPKAEALEAHPSAAVTFHWDTLDRQVRIEGPITRTPETDSDTYFASRPWLSKVSAWASNQSQPIASGTALNAQLADAMRRFGLDPANPPADDAQIDIPRPPHWGGYRLWFRSIELWLAGAGRLHDRARWTRPLEQAGSEFVTAAEARWSATRLQP